MCVLVSHCLIIHVEHLKHYLILDVLSRFSLGNVDSVSL